MQEAITLSPAARGLAFPEGPRWHDGTLWCSDIADGRVLRVASDGSADTIAEGIERPSGLGWLPDGRMLVVAGAARRLVRRDADGWVLHADLFALAPASCNDMVVDRSGRAYVGNWGFDYESGMPPRTTQLISVEPEGCARREAGDLLFPNGCVITPESRKLIAAETFGGRLTAFDIDEDGRLRAPRTWAALERARPDGICLDAEGAIWLASPPTREVLRVREGGEVTHRIATELDAVACMLGGDDRRSLFVLSTQLFERVDGVRRFTSLSRMRELRLGRIDIARVDVPGAGQP
jgi:sugar lactone lactonase YvrE